MRCLPRPAVLFAAFVVVVSAVSTPTVGAKERQEPLENRFYWLNLCGGWSSVGDDTAKHSMALGASASYQFGRHVLTLRSLGAGELFGKTTADVALLYGWGTYPSAFHISGGAGVALVDGYTGRGFSSEKEFGPAVGLPLEVQLFWRPLRVVGVGLYGFANINAEDSFGGAMLCLQFGKLRPNPRRLDPNAGLGRSEIR